jgi:pimeloyl-ACP methyl ester carboxylesterase
MLLCGLLSIPAMPIVLLLSAVVTVVGLGLCIDLLIARSPKFICFGAIALPIVAVLALGFIRPGTVKKVFRESEKKFPVNRLGYVGVGTLNRGHRIVLQTGAVAWLDYPSGEAPYPGAIFFHGAHPKGSRESSALVLRRTLLDAGFVVLSVDHPGYGESPIPAPKGDLNAWDPLPTDLAALRTLRNIKVVDENRILVLGHSAGTYEVFRLLRTLPNIKNAVAFGASLNDPKERDEYWYERFHSDRGMQDRIPRKLFDEIRSRFYDNGRAVTTLNPAHPPVVFVRFGLEWPHLAATRDILFQSIPGRKHLLDIDGSSHYFNSFDIANLLVGDTSVPRLLSSTFRLLAARGESERGAATKR